jgi:hypothetical protein
MVIILCGTAHAEERQPQDQKAGPAKAGDPAEAARVAEETAAAQERAARRAVQRDLASIVSLKVQVTLSKYRDEKKLSSLPYELTLRTDGTKSGIRMGASVPVPSIGTARGTAGASPDGAQISPFAFTYRDVGTNIDGEAGPLDPGRYRVTITIDDTSVYVDSDGANDRSSVSGVPTFRTYRSTNALVVRDGQTSEFTVATDKITGEVIRASVTVAVVK